MTSHCSSVMCHKSANPPPSCRLTLKCLWHIYCKGKQVIHFEMGIKVVGNKEWFTTIRNAGQREAVRCGSKGCWLKIKMGRKEGLDGWRGGVLRERWRAESTDWEICLKSYLSPARPLLGCGKSHIIHSLFCHVLFCSLSPAHLMQ